MQGELQKLLFFKACHDLKTRFTLWIVKLGRVVLLCLVKSTQRIGSQAKHYPLKMHVTPKPYVRCIFFSNPFMCNKGKKSFVSTHNKSTIWRTYWWIRKPLKDFDLCLINKTMCSWAILGSLFSYRIQSQVMVQKTYFAAWKQLNVLQVNLILNVSINVYKTHIYTSE